MNCLVCGGDHVPSAAVCDPDGMDRQAEKLGAKRWNAITAHVAKVNNRVARPCDHPLAKISEGPRVPMRWGSGPTQVCECGMYRVTLHLPGPWQPGPPDTQPDPEV